MGCKQSVNISKTQYIVNLASVQSFFHDKSLGDLTGNTYLQKPLPVQLPAFRHFSHEFHKFISKDIKRSHDLHKFSERVRNDSLVFNELSDVVLHHMSQIMTTEDNNLLLTPRFSSISWWIQWTGIIFAYLSMAMVLYLFYKFRIFGSAIAFFKTTSAAQPTNFPSFLAYGNDKLHCHF